MSQGEPTKLLTVEDAFFIEGRGVLVMPMVTDYAGPTAISVVLRKPNGEESNARARLDIPRISPPREPFPFVCSLAGCRKQDVPIGTEIWIAHEAHA